MPEVLKGFRIEIPAWGWVQYVVAESPAKAKAGVMRCASAAQCGLTYGHLRSCRRFPFLDGREEGEHATYELRYGAEVGIGINRNRTDIPTEMRNRDGGEYRRCAARTRKGRPCTWRATERVGDVDLCGGHARSNTLARRDAPRLAGWNLATTSQGDPHR